MQQIPTRTNRAEPPLPSLTPDTQDFFTRGAHGELAIHRCADCAYYIHPPVPRCPVCLSARVRSEAVSGRGAVAAFTINEYSWHPAFDPPYAVAIVELAEQQGLRLTTRIVDADPYDVRVGMLVHVTFEAHGEIYLPLFRPVTADV
ncbi:OB-fold domain-containing protein [Dactylosporangium sp. NPDC005572]|uniref:Zn-ribbon domain-containing OB-fold protein n=1 Tax=Dactylosporangium sp. NPDC005572 TaxID=3156889 RepID=UPI0033A475AA